MQNESSTIFDQDFLKQTLVRRRQLMPLALKIYVWFYLALCVYGAVTYIFVNLIRGLDVIRYESIDKFLFISIFTGLASPVLRFLSNLFIWLEKKSAILMGIIITVLHILYYCVSLFITYNVFKRFDFIWTIPLELLEIPYLVLLLKIRKRWEQTGISGKEQHFYEN